MKYFEKDKVKKNLIFSKKFYNIYQSDFEESKKNIIQINKKIKIGGRIISLKKIGGIIFGNLNRNNEIYQFCIKKNNIKNNLFEQSNFLTIGSNIGINGKWILSNTKILTILVDNFVILSNFLLTLPDKKKFLIKQQRQNRLIDLTFNINYRKCFLNKFILLKELRLFLFKNKFIEVETPVLNKYIGGADAQPFQTLHNKLKKKLYLSIAPELYLKKIITIGFTKIFQIAKCFRNEGISNKHNPEFLMIEFYIAFFNYKKMMIFIEKLIKYLYKKIYKKNFLYFNNHKIDFFKKWKKINFIDFLDKKINDFNIKQIYNNNLNDKIKEIISYYKIENIIKDYEKKIKNLTIYEKLYILFDECFSDYIIEPTFITEHPIRFSGLARKLDNIRAARAELYIGGMEISNLYSELNNPFEQQKFFNTQPKKHRDKEFIEALKIGMPNTSGAGIGIDRINMLFQNITNIKDSILFPLYKK